MGAGSSREAETGFSRIEADFSGTLLYDCRCVLLSSSWILSTARDFIGR